MNAAISSISFGAFETKLWPGSLMFFGLDAPNATILDITLFYAIALVGNAFLYVVIGVLTWPLAYIARRLRITHS